MAQGPAQQSAPLGTYQDLHRRSDHQREDDEVDDFSRELGGALVYFNHDAKVRKVILPIDFSHQSAGSMRSLFKIAEKVWRLVSAQIATICPGGQQTDRLSSIVPRQPTLSHTRYHILDRNYMILTVQGDNADDLTAAKIAIAEILRGTTMKHNDKPIWTPSLSSNGRAFRHLKKIEKDHQVVIVDDREQHELRLLGDPSKFEIAKAAVLAMLSGQASKSLVNEPPPNSKGFQTETTSGLRTKHVEHIECAVCLDIPQDPILTKCGHHYCSQCLQALCAAAGSSWGDFSLTCAACEVAFSLEELDSTLAPKSFEDLLKASFASHIKRNQHTYNYCSKPDCGGIYRLTDEVEVSTCPKCFTIVCMSCRAPHDGKTCAEYRHERSGDDKAMQKWKQDNNVKDCPNCGVGIDKDPVGCDIVQCFGCDVLLCWSCMEHFRTWELCSAHLTEQHGMTGNDDRPVYASAVIREGFQGSNAGVSNVDNGGSVDFPLYGGNQTDLTGFRGDLGPMRDIANYRRASW